MQPFYSSYIHLSFKLLIIYLLDIFINLKLLKSSLRLFKFCCFSLFIIVIAVPNIDLRFRLLGDKLIVGVLILFK